MKIDIKDNWQFSALCTDTLQLGSEYQTRRVLEWLKVVQSLNVHELNSCLITDQLTERPLGYQTCDQTAIWLMERHLVNEY